MLKRFAFEGAKNDKSKFSFYYWVGAEKWIGNQLTFTLFQHLSI